MYNGVFIPSISHPESVHREICEHSSHFQMLGKTSGLISPRAGGLSLPSLKLAKGLFTARTQLMIKDNLNKFTRLKNSCCGIVWWFAPLSSSSRGVLRQSRPDRVNNPSSEFCVLPWGSPKLVLPRKPCLFSLYRLDLHLRLHYLWWKKNDIT